MAGRALRFVLSLIAGSTDMIGFFGLNGLFTAHITGNVVFWPPTSSLAIQQYCLTSYRFRSSR
jgi:hypothetical protein